MPRLDGLRSFALTIFTAFLLALSAQTAGAVNPDEILDDPALEQRARDLSAEIRCMKCQNQSIDDSDADLARDLRILVRERLVEGDSDEQVLDFLVDRYGEFVLLKPRFSSANMILWLAPFLALGAGLFLAWRYLSRGRNSGKGADAIAPARELSADEQAQLTRILGDRD